MGKVIRYEQCPRCNGIGRDTRGDNLGVYSDGSTHCFSCGWHTFPTGLNRIKGVNDVQTNKGFADGSQKPLLPADFTWNVPARAWQWVIQYGLPISYWSPFTGYSEAEERLVFRVGGRQDSRGEPLRFSIGRYVGIAKTGAKKWYVWGDPHKHCEVVGRADSEVVVLVEDLISAHKVAQVGSSVATTPLFGTKLHPCHIHYLGTSPSLSRVILWLDKDQEFNVRKTALRLESLINKPVKVVITEKDPKWLSYEKIQSVIW